MEQFVADIEGLLQPVPGANPAGESVRYEGTYDRINEARRDEDDSLSRGIWERPLKRAEWVEAARLCDETVRTRSKDLQVASWLLESWVHLHGFAGAREGMRLLTALCERYWQSMYPEQADPEYRVSIIEWIDEKVALSLKFIPVTAPDPETGRSYNWADWENACFEQQAALQEAGKKKTKEKGSSEEVSPVSIEQRLRDSPSEFVQSLYMVLDEIVNSSQALEKILDQYMGATAPSVRKFRAATTAIRDWVHPHVARYIAESMSMVHSDENALAPASGVHTAILTSSPATAAAAAAALKPVQEIPVGYTGMIRSRAEAYQCLAEAAEFLQRTEPHSPAPYLVKRAIQWGSMGLNQLLPELIRNDQALLEISELLNIHPESQSQEDED